jgi:hypothetical protein
MVRKTETRNAASCRTNASEKRRQHHNKGQQINAMQYKSRKVCKMYKYNICNPETMNWDQASLLCVAEEAGKYTQVKSVRLVNMLKA